MSEPAGTASGAPWHRTQPWRRKGVVRRGNRMQLTFAHIELAMEGLIAVDRLLVLNQALANELQDDAGGR
jgi:hypothetical protein